MVSPAQYQKDFHGWKSVPFAIFAYIPFLIFLVVRFSIRSSKFLLSNARKRGFSTFLIALLFVLLCYTTSILGFGYTIHSVLANLDRNQQLNAIADARSNIRFGKCDGFGLELQKMIPKEAISAGKKLLNNLKPIDLGNYSLVDVVAESTVPHLCDGNLYSGKIPPGANTAYFIQFSHEKTDLIFERSTDGVVTIVTSKPHTKSRVLVANYPEIGWQAVYSDSTPYKGFFR